MMNDIIRADDFDFDIIRKTPLQKKFRGNPGTTSKARYKDLVCAFDIETTPLDCDQAIMYIWQFQVDTICTVIGRTWDEFIRFRDGLCDALKENEWLVVYDHNLSYEFAFIKDPEIYPFTADEVFAVDSRKILKCTMSKHLEFRCSYLHSNMTLEKFLEFNKVEHPKLTMDYSIKRYPWTELTDEELAYCVNDVRGLVEAIRHEMKRDGDNLYTIPLTSTGYVREDAKGVMRHLQPGYIKRQLSDANLYTMQREAFRGGNTHGNRYYAGQIINDADSYDESSAYPFQLCCREFPISAFYHEGQISVDRLIQLINVRRKAVLMRVRFLNIRLADQYWGCPYLSRDKCRDIVNGKYDNGRILSADYLELTCTDIDLQIILKEYDFDDLNPYDVYSARYGRLPKAFRELICSYFRIKTELKGNEDESYYYGKAKNKLNSLYGMCAQDPVKRSIIYNGETFEVDEKTSVQELLEKHNKKAFLPYTWGVWCTAWARYSLEEGLWLVGDQFLYTDTDSIKYWGSVDWSELNEERKQMAIEAGAYATDPQGVTHYMGVFEHDHQYSKFITLGAKKYAGEEDGKITLTLAGCNKKLGAMELAEHGGLTAFHEGMVFTKAGGTEAVYNDVPETREVSIDGHKLHITSNCLIRNSTYTLGITQEYSRLLSECLRIKYADYNIALDAQKVRL